MFDTQTTQHKTLRDLTKKWHKHKVCALLKDKTIIGELGNRYRVGLLFLKWRNLDYIYLKNFVVISQSNLQSSKFKGLPELNGSLLVEFFCSSVSFCVGLINAAFHKCQAS